ncbi:MAG: hypothetical protein Q4F13_09645 [Pseudomonadota bacterium]|nr:hypothetical protein [Pseudomonadota bacterium]
MATEKLDLSGVHVQNWRTDCGPPPVVLNPDATVHACIAWAWGELYEVKHLAMVGLSADEADTPLLIEAIHSRINAAESVLRMLGELTRNDSRTVAQWQEAMGAEKARQ